MFDNKKKLYQLAIETAVGGGSLTLSKGGKDVDSWIGDGRVSKVEEVLRQIRYLFEQNNISKNEVSAIRVSRGPGSYTGARIGIATALGLRKSLRCRLDGLSVLEAMSSLKTKGLAAIIVVPVGTSRVAWQQIGGEVKNFKIPSSPIRLTDVREFTALLKAERSPDRKELIVHRDLYSVMVENFRYLRGETKHSSNTFQKESEKYIVLKVDNVSSILNSYGTFLESLESSKNLPHYKNASDNVSAIYLANE